MRAEAPPEPPPTSVGSGGAAGPGLAVITGEPTEGGEPASGILGEGRRRGGHAEAEPVVVGNMALEGSGGVVEGIPVLSEAGPLDLSRELDAPREDGVRLRDQTDALRQWGGHRCQA